MVGRVNKRSTLVAGVGTNDADYPIKGCKIYQVWAAMLNRCFSPQVHGIRPNYKDCTVDPSWLSFSVFRRWMLQQSWEGKVLDKDILLQGNKHYGPDTCAFISRELNNLLTLRANHRGQYPLGVSKTTCKGYEYFIASCSFYGKQKRLGYYKTVDEAATAYKVAKLGYIRELATKEMNPEVKRSLLNIY